MSYEGTIPAGSTVKAELALAGTASGPASLTGAFAPKGVGSPDNEGTVVAPGSADWIDIEVTGPGILRFVVDMKDQDDTGTLTVSVDGSEKTKRDITGDTTWGYSGQAAG